jgi:hypothetical protein
MVRQSRVAIAGLVLPLGSRERFRQIDLRYVYAPVQGQLSLGYRGDDRTPRQAVRGVLDDILGIVAPEGATVQ